MYVTERVSTYISKHHKEELTRRAFETKIPISRLIAIALDNELSRPDAFEFDSELPTDEFMEYSYADQAAKLVRYLKDVEGLGADQLLLVRHDVGIPDKDEFLFALRECLNAGIVEEFKPKKGIFKHMDHAEGYMCYRLTSKNPKYKKEQINKAKRFEKLQRLKKEFRNVE